MAQNLNTKGLVLKELIHLSGLNKKDFCIKHKVFGTQLSPWIKGEILINDSRLSEIAKKEGYELNYFLSPFLIS